MNAKVLLLAAGALVLLGVSISMTLQEAGGTGNFYLEAQDEEGTTLALSSGPDGVRYEMVSPDGLLTVASGSIVATQYKDTVSCIDISDLPKSVATVNSDGSVFVRDPDSGSADQGLYFTVTDGVVSSLVANGQTFTVTTFAEDDAGVERATIDTSNVECKTGTEEGRRLGQLAHKRKLGLRSASIASHHHYLYMLSACVYGDVPDYGLRYWRNDARCRSSSFVMKYTDSSMENSIATYGDVLIFRGSDTADDWVTNGMSAFDNFDSGWDKIKHLIPARSGKWRYCTGHSLGGALAVRAAQKGLCEETVTFAAPPVAGGIPGSVSRMYVMYRYADVWGPDYHVWDPVPYLVPPFSGASQKDNRIGKWESSSWYDWNYAAVVAKGLKSHSIRLYDQYRWQ